MTARGVVRHPWFVPLALALLTVAFFGHVLFAAGGDALLGGDFQQVHYPLLKFVVDSARDTGALPLWNPHQFLGYSVVGNPQYGLFYPPNWLLLALGGDRIAQGVSWLVVAHAFWAALGMAWLARLWGADPLPALIAGAIAGFGGFLAGRIVAGHYAMILAFAWVPWVMAGCRLAVRRAHPLWALPGGMALALSILAGHPQMIYLLGLGLAAQWAYEALTARDRLALIACTRQFALVGAAGLILSAVSWLPAWDYLPKTDRGAQQDSLAFANEHAVRADQLVTLLVPNLFGSPQSESYAYWLDTPNYEEMAGYAGVLPLILLPLGARARQRPVWLFLALAGLGVLLSLGADGALYAVLHRWLPPVRGFRAPGRALALTTIGLGGASALILTALGRLSAAERRACLSPLLARAAAPLIAALWAGALILTVASVGLEGAPGERLGHIAGQLALSGLFCALVGGALWAWTAAPDGGLADRAARGAIAILVVLDVWHVAWPLAATGAVAPAAAWQTARAVLPQDQPYGRVMQLPPPPSIPNGASWTGLYSTQGYDPIAPAGWAALGQNAGWDPAAPLNRLMGVRYTLSNHALDHYGWADTADFRLLAAGDPLHIYENPDALPRAYLVARYETVADLDLTLQRLMLGHASGGDVALLAQDPACPIASAEGTVTIVRYHPNEVIVQVEHAGPGMLVLADQYDDDWQVEIDGQRAALLRADYALRAVCLPDGARVVRFVYRPWAFRAGRAISIAGWVLLAALGGVLIARHRRRLRAT